MAIDEPSELVPFDAEAMVRAGQNVAGPTFAAFVEYHDRDLHPMYITDTLLGMYSNEEHMREHFWDIKSYYSVDQTERKVFERTLSMAGDARYVATQLEYATMVRIYQGEHGAWITFGPGAPVWETMEAIGDVLESDERPSPFDIDEANDPVATSDTEQSRVVHFDAADALDVAQDIAGDELLACLEYTRNDASVRYRSERFDAAYETDADRDDALDEIVSFCHLDFGERMLFEQEFPAAGDVTGFWNRLDHAVAVRLVTDQDGFLLLLTPEAPISETVDAVQKSVVSDPEPTSSTYPTGQGP